LDLVEEIRPLSHLESCLRSLIIEALHSSIKERWIYWKTRAKVKFAISGDENTGYFHALASCRKRHNTIPILDHDGTAFADHPSKARILHDFFKNLLGATSMCSWNFNLSDLYPNGNALPATLVDPFSVSDIKTALHAMNKNASPGPDGFGPSFFSTFWDTVSADVHEVFASFFLPQYRFNSYQRAFLVLLPKFEAARTPGDFRPISLQNCILKLITKVLTSRLQSSIHALVDPDQTGFLSGRRISKNIVYAADLVRCCHLRKVPTIVFKIDFWKAFNSINWVSLLAILHSRGFPPRWCSWI
jgi:hypothetical protein